MPITQDSAANVRQSVFTSIEACRRIPSLTNSTLTELKSLAANSEGMTALEEGLNRFSYASDSASCIIICQALSEGTPTEKTFQALGRRMITAGSVIVAGSEQDKLIQALVDTIVKLSEHAANFSIESRANCCRFIDDLIAAPRDPFAVKRDFLNRPRSVQLMFSEEVRNSLKPILSRFSVALVVVDDLERLKVPPRPAKLSAVAA